MKGTVKEEDQDDDLLGVATDENKKVLATSQRGDDGPSIGDLEEKLDVVQCSRARSDRWK